jgi:catechol 2,3-dioxygenase-like lactoylglutathione lyase family enzyme
MKMAAEASVVWLPVTNLGRALEFYRDRLGLSENRRESAWAELDAGGLRIGLNAREEETQGDGGAVIAFHPDGQLDDAVAQLRDAGVEFADGVSEHPWGRVAAFRDPDGNSLQLYEPPNGS